MPDVSVLATCSLVCCFFHSQTCRLDVSSFVTMETSGILEFALSRVMIGFPQQAHGGMDCLLAFCLDEVNLSTSPWVSTDATLLHCKVLAFFTTASMPIAVSVALLMVKLSSDRRRH